MRPLYIHYTYIKIGLESFEFQSPTHGLWCVHCALKLREARPSLDRKEQRGSALLLVAADSFVDARRQPTISPEEKEKKREIIFCCCFVFLHAI